MKSLQDHLRQYVAARRALGTQLREPAKTLSGFIQFLGRKKSKFITTSLALEWSQQSKNVQRATWARKLSMVRQFARWLSVLEPRHQVPPPRLLNVRHRRNKPHIYSDQEIARLMAAAAALKSPRGMKGLTLGALIGLLAATGLRPGEAGALENQALARRAARSLFHQQPRLLPNARNLGAPHPALGGLPRRFRAQGGWRGLEALGAAASPLSAPTWTPPSPARACHPSR